MEATAAKPGIPERVAAAIAALAPLLALVVVLAWPPIRRAFRPKTTHVLLCSARSFTVFFAYACVLLMVTLFLTFFPHAGAAVLPATRALSTVQAAFTFAIAVLALAAPSLRIPVLDDVAESIVAWRHT